MSVFAKTFQFLGLFVGILVATVRSSSEPRIQSQTFSIDAAKRSITVADSVRMTRLGPPDYFSGSSPIAHFSPDGTQFVIMLRQGNLTQNTDDVSLLLYQTARVSQAPKPDLLLKMSSSSNRVAITRLRWLADNETLVFLGENPGENAQIYSFNVSQRSLRQLTHQATAITNYDITADGRRIAFIADAPEHHTPCEEHTSSQEIVIQGQHLANILEGDYSEPKGRELFWLTIGEVVRAVPVDEKYFVDGLSISLSPDGRYIVFPASLRNVPSAWAKYRDLVAQQAFAINFPKGTIPPFLQYLLFDTLNITLAPLVNAPILGSFDSVSWAKDGQSVFLSSFLPLDVVDPAERDARERDKYPIEVALPGRTYRKIPKDKFPVNPIRGGPFEVTVEQTLNMPPKLYFFAPTNKQKTLLLDLNPQFEELSFGEVRTIEWTVHGIKMLGGLYLPSNFQPTQRYPLVIQTHGFEPNEFSMDGRSEWSSGYAARPMAARGILVLQAAKFASRQDYNRVRDDRKLGRTSSESFRTFNSLVFETAVELLSRAGLIDKNLVGIIGFSRTACFVGYTLTHSKYRFAAASLVDGISCGYFEEIAEPEEAWDVNNINGGASPFGEGLRLWTKNSPGFNLHKVRTPVRLVSLGNASILSAWEWYAGLSLLKKPVDFAVMPEAVHIGLRPSQRLLTEQGIVDWFSYWLLGEEDPDPVKRDQYIRWSELGNLVASSTGK